MNTIAQDFRKLLDNNSDKDWNNLTFRQTMADAFRFNVDKRVGILKEKLDTDQNRELVNEAFPEEIK